MKRLLTILMLTPFLLGLPMAFGQQEDVSEVTKRMKERLERIAELKQEHVIGETLEGYLAIANAPEDAEKKKEVEALVEAENSDRKTVYTIIARRAGTSVAQVAKQRARQLYERSEAGVLLQGKDGAWYEKTEDG